MSQSIANKSSQLLNILLDIHISVQINELTTASQKDALVTISKQLDSIYLGFETLKKAHKKNIHSLWNNTATRMGKNEEKRVIDNQTIPESRNSLNFK